MPLLSDMPDEELIKSIRATELCQPKPLRSLDILWREMARRLKLLREQAKE